MLGQALPGAPPQRHIDHRQHDRHHHRGGGGVGHPHAHERRGGHGAADDRLRARAHQLERGEGDAPVEPPALNGQRQHEAAEKEEDHVRAVVGRGARQWQDAGQRERRDRQQCGDFDVDRLGHPPGGHPGHHRQRGAARLRKRHHLALRVGVGLGQHQVQAQRQHRPQKQPHPFHALLKVLAHAGLRLLQLQALSAAAQKMP